MEQLGRYLLERKLAQGGMAEVFLARQQNASGPGRTCVVKRMLPHLSEDLTFVEMFLDEARVVARLAHPGIAQVIDFGHERDTYFLALEYVAGANLKAVLDQRLEANKPIPLPVAARLISLVARALDYAHHSTDEKGAPLEVIHRDVSPHNVMVGINGDVKLIDFGIAKAKSDSHRTVAGTLKGKYAYMSPEQLRQQKVDQRTDVYALGLVLYELITGRPAVAPNENMNALMMAAAQRRYAPIDQHRPETPKRLRQILDKALALDPNDRYGRGNELADQLEEWLLSIDVRVTAKDLALLVDPRLVSTDPMAEAAPPPAPSRAPARLSDDELPPTVVGSSVREARTLQDLAMPRELRATVASQRAHSPPGSTKSGGDLTPLMGTASVDPSSDPTPIVGTPAVARRGVGAATDVSMMPTEPDKVAPDIKAALARPPKKATNPPEKAHRASAPHLEEVTSPSVPKPAFVVGPAAEPRSQSVDTEPMPPTTALMPPPGGRPAPPEARPRRWPWLVAIMLLLPIGAAAAGLLFLPKESAARAKLVDVLGPVLKKLQR